MICVPFLLRALNKNRWGDFFFFENEREIQGKYNGNLKATLLTKRLFFFKGHVICHVSKMTLKEQDFALLNLKRNVMPFFSASFLEMGGLKAFDSPQGNSSTLEIFRVCRKASCQNYLSLPPSGSFCLFPNTCFQIRKNCTISSCDRFFSRPVTNLFQLFQRIDRGFLKVFYYLK